MKMMAILAAVVVLMAVAAYFVVSMFLAPKSQPTEPGAAKVKEQEKSESRGEAGKGEIFMVEELLVNPTGTSGTRYLSASLGLEVPNHEVAVKLEELKLQVRDLMIGILSSRTVDQLTTAPEREKMRLEIMDRMNKLIAPDRVLAVYFVDYVLQ